MPTNFSIMRAENGYEVYSPENELLGIAPTLEDASSLFRTKGMSCCMRCMGCGYQGLCAPRQCRAASLHGTDNLLVKPDLSFASRFTQHERKVCQTTKNLKASRAKI